jgi:hypothetical protein
MIDEETKRKAWRTQRPNGLWYAWSQPYWLTLQQKYHNRLENIWKLGRLLDYPEWPDFLLEEGSDRFMFRDKHQVEQYHTFVNPSAFVRFAESLNMPFHLTVLNARAFIKQSKGKTNGQTQDNRRGSIFSAVERIPPRTDYRYTEILLSEE